MTEEEALAEVLQAVRSVISDTKTGSAIDRYRTENLWDLGDALIRRGGPETGGVPGADTVLQALRTLGVPLYPTVLKNAVRVRQYWPEREAFIKVASSLGSYGKLKDVLQLFDPSAGVPVSDLQSFLDFASSATYVDTLNRAADLKSRFLKREERGLPDIDALAEAIAESTETLRRMIDSGNQEAIRSAREALTPDVNRNLRLLMSALQNPDVYSRYRSQIRSSILPSPEELEIRGHAKLGEVVRILTPLRSANPRIFPRIANEIGRPYIGELATLLKAVESPVELGRYLKNQEVLRRFLERAGG